MRKNVSKWMLLTALVFGLGITVTSCKDDDEENKSEAQKEQEAQEKASKFWNVVGQLVSVDDVTEDYKGKTFETTYGLADPTNEVTRIVNTNDMKTAAQRFANLVDAKGIDENTSSYTWNDPDIGSMTYTRGGTPAEWATVDVNIKAVPGLQKIIYREGGEGTNGKFAGKAYYRFGDVVSRQVIITYDQKKNNDNRKTITEYWICVRPAFGPEGKEDSHWVCVNTVSDKNYKYYKASTGTEYWLPTNLKTDKENMQNFAELLWAICRPDDWYKNVNEHHRDGKLWGFDGVPFFTDFKKANLDLHNQYFWQNVQDGWNRKQIAEQALNMPSLGALIDVIRANGVHLLYNGYSWIFLTSWNCELSEAVYTNGKAEEELNMHHAVYNEDIERNMKDIIFDVRTMGKDKDNYNGFFNSDGKYRWVIRHATGKELANDKKFDVKKPISGVNEVYRYYRDVKTLSLNEQPEETEEDVNNMSFENRCYYTRGDVVQDIQGNRWFCIQCSTFGIPTDICKYNPYAYFISLDKGAVGENLENIVSTKNLGMQMLYNLIYAYHDFANEIANLHSTDENPHENYLYLRNVEKQTGYKMLDLVATRDSIVVRKGVSTSDPNEFLSTLYRDYDGELCILRALNDNTLTEKGEGRTWAYHFWTVYSSDKSRRMTLKDLADQDVINQYNKDIWVYLPWHDYENRTKVTANIGPRTTTEAITPLSRFIFQNNRSVLLNNTPANIYREPIVAFAVKRVRDEGSANTAFEDGTMFTPIRMIKEEGEHYRIDQVLGVAATTSGGYESDIKRNGFFFNGEPYAFGLDNTP